MHAGGSLPQTAAVNLADYVRAFTELSKKNDFVIHVCISLDFSCCYQNAKLAAADFDNVYVVDSRNLSTGHGLVVLEAERMAREGMAPDDIVAALHDMTVNALRVYSVSFLVFGFNIFGSAFFTGLNDGTDSALISFLRTLVIQVAAILILPKLLGIDGIWLAITVAEALTLIVTETLFLLGRKKYHYA